MAIKRIFYASLLPLILVVWGCESVALIGRRDIGAVERAVARDEIVGTVERVDGWDNELHVRSADGLMNIIKYDEHTRVLGRGDRELRPEILRPGDHVRVQMDEQRAQFANVIDLQPLRR
jgi:hypothetical protein